jgi:hypothetical protein
MCILSPDSSGARRAASPAGPPPQQLALDALAGVPVSQIALDQQVSHKFVYQQYRAGASARSYIGCGLVPHSIMKGSVQSRGVGRSRCHLVPISLSQRWYAGVFCQRS